MAGYLGTKAVLLSTTAANVTGNATIGGNLDVSSGTIKLDGNYPVGTGNVALGDAALDDGSLSGGYNTAIGSNALTSNTTSSNNTAVGYQAGYAGTTGTNSTFLGSYAGATTTTSSNQTLLGHAAGRYVTGDKNTFVGTNSGDAITTGSKNTILGRYNGNNGGLDIRTSSNNIVLSDGDGNPKLFINSSGYIMNQNAITGMDLGFGQQSLSIKETDGSSAAIFGNTHGSSTTLITYASDTSYAGIISDTRCGRSNNSAYYFEFWRSSGNADNEFYLRGDGNAFADGSWNGGGADYAEYFEWADGNPSNEDRRGYSVVLENSKMRKATTDDNPALIFGVISARPAVIGDNDMMAWKNKYLKDDFGAYVRDENDERILNPDYDPDQEYTSREDRPEWDTVGLMGKLRIRKGQPTGSNWIKMRDVSDTVEEWLVR